MARVHMSGPGRSVVVIDALRTPIGRYLGALSPVRPDDLAAQVISNLIARNLAFSEIAIDDVVFGGANQAGEDNRNVGRMAALLAGLPVSTPGSTVNRLCGSSLEALLVGYRAIALGEAECVVVGGVESMSRAPYVLSREDHAAGDASAAVDTTLGWRFVNEKMPERYTVSLGMTAENVADQLGIGREEQDQFALSSHRRAVNAADRGDFDTEIVPVTTSAGLTISRDEGPRRDTSRDALARLSPVFREGGTVTAGNSSPRNDGAAALLLASAELADRLGVEGLATVLGGAVAGVSPEVMGLGPVPSTLRLLNRLHLVVGDLDAIEINEAFAAQVIGALRKLEMDPLDERINLLGGAIALGHPLGASGARIATTLVHRLTRDGGGLGLATMCIGVGQGISVLFER